MSLVMKQSSHAFHVLYHALDTGYIEYLEAQLKEEQPLERRHAMSCSLRRLKALSEFVDRVTEEDLCMTSDGEQTWKELSGDEARDADGQLTRIFKATCILVLIQDEIENGKQIARILQASMPASSNLN